MLRTILNIFKGKWIYIATINGVNMTIHKFQIDCLCYMHKSDYFQLHAFFFSSKNNFKSVVLKFFM